ncbi:MAG: hypothetical protein H6584_03470 [Flavobacteriales bacterium]|nr:hypothetical protein [Flavobacteriales bacterium]
MYSPEEIRENYKKLSNLEIEEIASSEAKSLRPEIIPVLKDELIRRNLDPELITWVDAEVDVFSELEKQTLIRKIENLNCPKCDQRFEKLRAYEIQDIVSLVFWSYETKATRILCPSCGRKAKFNAIITTAILGWWSKSGILLTPYILIKELVNAFFLDKIHNRVLNEFLEAHTAIIRLEGSDEKTLRRLVEMHNKDYKLENN